MTKTDRRSAAGRPGSIAAGLFCINDPNGPPEKVRGLRFREIDGENPINFDDHISEEHAKAVANLIRPLLVDEWKMNPTHDWGKYIIKNEGWVDQFIIATLYNIDEIKVIVRVDDGRRHGGPNGKFITVPLEHPHTIELAAQFVFEEIREYSHTTVLINRPIFPATV